MDFILVWCALGVGMVVGLYLNETTEQKAEINQAFWHLFWISFTVIAWPIFVFSRIKRNYL